MILRKEDRERLKVKNARKAATAYRVLSEYCKDQRAFGIDACPKFKEDLKPGTYAYNIWIVSSRNKSQIYGFVEDSNGDTLASASAMNTDPSAYANVARYCGAFMEAFNLYCFYNDI